MDSSRPLTSNKGLSVEIKCINYLQEAISRFSCDLHLTGEKAKAKMCQSRHSYELSWVTPYNKTSGGCSSTYRLYL